MIGTGLGGICLIWCMSGRRGSRPLRSLRGVLMLRCIWLMSCCRCLVRRLWCLFLLVCVVLGWVGLVVGRGFVGLVGESIKVARTLRRGVRGTLGAYGRAPPEAARKSTTG